MHKSEQYGKILLKQKDKQNESNRLNFAYKLARSMPFDVSIVEASIRELIEEGVLHMEGDALIQKRMVKDNEISEIRSKSGRKGAESKGKKDDFADTFANNFAKAKPQANTENESEYENESEIVIETVMVWPTFDDFWNAYKKKVDKPKVEKLWNKLNQKQKEQVMAHVPAYVASTPDPVYRKNPQTYLNSKSYENEIIIKNTHNNNQASGFAQDLANLITQQHGNR